MYRFQLLSMSHGSAGLSPEAVANVYQVDPHMLPIDRKGPIVEMAPCPELYVYCFEAGELPGNHGPMFAFAYEKPNGVGRVLDSGSRSRGLYDVTGAVDCKKLRCFSTKGLNWVEFVCRHVVVPDVVMEAPRVVEGVHLPYSPCNR